MPRRFLSSIPRLLLVGTITADGRDKRRGLHIAYALMLYYDAMGLARAGSPVWVGGGEVVFYLGRLGLKTYWRVQESSGNAMRVRARAETLLYKI